MSGTYASCDEGYSLTEEGYCVLVLTVTDLDPLMVVGITIGTFFGIIILVVTLVILFLNHKRKKITKNQAINKASLDIHSPREPLVNFPDNNVVGLPKTGHLQSTEVGAMEGQSTNQLMFTVGYKNVATTALTVDIKVTEGADPLRNKSGEGWVDEHAMQDLLPGTISEESIVDLVIAQKRIPLKPNSLQPITDSLPHHSIKLVPLQLNRPKLEPLLLIKTQ